MTGAEFVWGDPLQSCRSAENQVAEESFQLAISDCYRAGIAVLPLTKGFWRHYCSHHQAVPLNKCIVPPVACFQNHHVQFIHLLFHRKARWTAVQYKLQELFIWIDSSTDVVADGGYPDEEPFHHSGKVISQ